MSKPISKLFQNLFRIMTVNNFLFCFVMGVEKKSSVLQSPITPRQQQPVKTTETGGILLVPYRNCTRSSNARDKMAMDRLAFFLFFPFSLEPASIAKEGSQERSWTWPSG